MTQVPDNCLVLRRATESCKTLDSLRYKLHTLQKKIAKARTNHTSTTPLTPAVSTIYTLFFRSCGNDKQPGRHVNGL